MHKATHKTSLKTTIIRTKSLQNHPIKNGVDSECAALQFTHNCRWQLPTNACNILMHLCDHTAG
jgi:hypothetical protein